MQTLIRKIGNSAGAIIPSPILKKLDLKVGDRINIQDNEGHIVISHDRTKATYTLTGLLAKCDESAPMPQELIDWDNVPEVGNEKW